MIHACIHSCASHLTLIIIGMLGSGFVSENPLNGSATLKIVALVSAFCVWVLCNTMSSDEILTRSLTMAPCARGENMHFVLNKASGSLGAALPLAMSLR